MIFRSGHSGFEPNLAQRKKRLLNANKPPHLPHLILLYFWWHLSPQSAHWGTFYYSLPIEVLFTTACPLRYFSLQPAHWGTFHNSLPIEVLFTTDCPLRHLSLQPAFWDTCHYNTFYPQNASLHSNTYIFIPKRPFFYPNTHIFIPKMPFFIRIPTFFPPIFSPKGHSSIRIPTFLFPKCHSSIRIPRFPSGSWQRTVDSSSRLSGTSSAPRVMFRLEKSHKSINTFVT